MRPFLVSGPDCLLQQFSTLTMDTDTHSPCVLGVPVSRLQDASVHNPCAYRREQAEITCSSSKHFDDGLQDAVVLS